MWRLKYGTSKCHFCIVSCCVELTCGCTLWSCLEAERLLCWFFHLTDSTTGSPFHWLIHQTNSFVTRIYKEYYSNPYHNFRHAFDVMQTVFALLTSMNAGTHQHIVHHISQYHFTPRSFSTDNDIVSNSAIPWAVWNPFRPHLRNMSRCGTSRSHQ